MIRTWLAGILIALATFINPPVAREKPLEKYTIENLAKRGGIASEITYKDDLFYFKSDNKTVSGVINKPEKSNGKTVVMLHGSASKEEYYPGFGTQKLAKFLTKNGFTTYAPDFFGYGESSPSAKDDFEDRFQTYTTTMDLIASLNKPVILWGHSNGGQIALSVLAITGQSYPTVLWNPVGKPFPYSILYFTDGYEDEGKWLRQATATFEQDYDVNKYSFDKYLSNIKAPILLQQGENDPWVPKSWSDDLAKKINVKYIVYSGSDHNMLPLWDSAAKDLLIFLRSQ